MKECGSMIRKMDLVSVDESSHIACIGITTKRDYSHEGEYKDNLFHGKATSRMPLE